MATFKELVDSVQAESPIAASFTGTLPDGREYVIRVYDNGGLSVEMDGESFGKPVAHWWALADAQWNDPLRQRDQEDAARWRMARSGLGDRKWLDIHDELEIDAALRRS